MYTKILVPLDGSSLAEGILPYARGLVKALKVPVELFQVIDPDIVSAFVDPEHGRYRDTVEASMKQRSTAYLGRVAGSFPDPGRVGYSASIGRVAEVIVEKAAQDRNTLIAMATHGRSGLRRWMLGSVADKVLHATSNDLLLIRPTDNAKTEGIAELKTVLVPLDGSGLAETVLPHVVALARALKLETVLVRVYTLMETAYVADEFGYGWQLRAEEIKKEATVYLEERARQLQADGLERVSCVALEGSAAEEIVDLARQTPDNLVAMCTHGRSGVGRWVLGSVTDRVVRHCGDPVLVVRATAP